MVGQVAVELAEQAAKVGVHFLSLSGRGRLAGPDGPNRLVSDHKIFCQVAAHPL